jgi:hypothetical protein
MGRKVIRYGAKGDRIWGLGSFEVMRYGAKGDKIWGIGDKIWGEVLVDGKLLKLNGNNIYSRVIGDRIWGEGDRIWGIAFERLYLEGKTLAQRFHGTLKVIGYGAVMNEPASLR